MLKDSTIAISVLVALHVSAAALQARLPAPWEVTSTLSGPPRGANLYVVFQDVLLNQDGEGRPAVDATGRFVGLVTSARHAVTGEACSFNFRTYVANTAALPGKYRTAVAARIRAERHVDDTGQDTHVSERIVVEPATGGRLALDLAYRRSVPVRLPYEADVRSPVDPTIVRRYNVDQLVEPVLGVPDGVSHVDRYRLEVDVPEIRDLFDGSERTIAIGARPMFVRKVY